MLMKSEKKKRIRTSSINNRQQDEICVGYEASFTKKKEYKHYI